jgi:hypothetical protein
MMLFVIVPVQLTSPPPAQLKLPGETYAPEPLSMIVLLRIVPRQA